MSKSTAQLVHVLSVKSEACDVYGPFLFREKPSDDELLIFLNEHTSPDDCPVNDDERVGPGWRDTYLHLTWTRSEIR